MLLRQEVAEGETAVIRTRFDGHSAMDGAALFYVNDEAVVRIMHLADFLIAQRVVVGAAAGLAVDEVNIGAERRLIVKFECEGRILEDGLAMEGSRVDELAVRPGSGSGGIDCKAHDKLLIGRGELRRSWLCESRAEQDK